MGDLLYRQARLTNSWKTLKAALHTIRYDIYSTRAFSRYCMDKRMIHYMTDVPGMSDCCLNAFCDCGNTWVFGGRGSFFWGAAGLGFTGSSSASSSSSFSLDFLFLVLLVVVVYKNRTDEHGLRAEHKKPRGRLVTHTRIAHHLASFSFSSGW